jgi:outer membrane protein assembly factor BamB
MTDLWQSSLTRRQLIRLGAFSLAVPYLPRARHGPWSFVVFSDTHFGVGDNLVLNRTLLEEIALLEPSLVLNAGDVTERGWPEEYDDMDRAFAGLGLNVHHAPGNHEVRWAPLGLQIFGERVGPPHQVIEHGGCVFAQLDSTVPLSHWGHVGGPQRRWLEGELSRYGDAPVFVFLHHAPGRDPSALDDEDALADVLARFNTKVIFTGHGHRDLFWEWRGLQLTMGRGLYQGSYLRVHVDADADEIRLARRTVQTPTLQPFATLPLRARPVVTPAAAAAGAPAAHAPAAATPAAATGAGLTPAWTRALTGGVMSRLLLRDDTLFLSLMDGSVLALDTADGREQWRARTGGYCHSSPVVAGDTLVVGSADAHVYALDASSGALRWRFATRAPVYASAAVANDVVAIASGDGSIYGIDLVAGTLRWEFRLPPGPSAFAQSPAATDGQRFFIGAWDRHVYALDARTGAEQWRYLATPATFYYSAAIAAPAVAHERLYVPSNDGVLHALDAATGDVAWKQSSPGDKFGYSSPTIAGDRIFIGCLGERGEVRCVAADDGREVWVAATGATIYESSPAIVGDRVAIGSVNGTLWLLDGAHGRIVAHYRFPPGHFISTPAAAPGRVYAATFAEVVTALDVRP